MYFGSVQFRSFLSPWVLVHAHTRPTCSDDMQTVWRATTQSVLRMMFFRWCEMLARWRIAQHQQPRIPHVRVSSKTCRVGFRRVQHGMFVADRKVCENPHIFTDQCLIGFKSGLEHGRITGSNMTCGCSRSCSCTACTTDPQQIERTEASAA